MPVLILTGAAGLVGSTAAERFAPLGFDVVGIDNDLRARFFGEEASTNWNRDRLIALLGHRYRHVTMDVRDQSAVASLFEAYQGQIELVIHAAAQPSHDWAAREPFTDFSVNAVGTLNVLEAARQYAPEAPFIFTSTNKVYGDTPNRLPLLEMDTRWEIKPGHIYENGIAEDMSIDQTLHSLFGASKLGADVLVQEYGRYFGLPTVCFRAGTITGPSHAATALHGFLAYLMRCTMNGTAYSVIGYQGKQVRDAIHSDDLVAAFEAYWRTPRPGEVYNIGGGRHANTSVLEAIDLCQQIAGRQLIWNYTDENRVGDHIWWISDNARFIAHNPGWEVRYDIPSILEEIYVANRDRWTS